MDFISWAQEKKRGGRDFKMGEWRVDDMDEKKKEWEEQVK